MPNTKNELKHLALILDGNRRWAKQNGLPVIEGHRKGAEVFKDIALQIFDKGVKVVSAYVFSTENWQRAKEEVSFLMNLVIKATEKYLDDFKEKNIKVIVVGSRYNIPDNVSLAINKVETATKSNNGGTLALCFNYGGKEEILHAAQQLIQNEDRSINVNETVFERYLYSAELPPIDLLIRTSGEKRLSGFMLWKAAYAELYFTDTLWPDIKMQDIDKAIADYHKRIRRFGT